MRPLDRDGQTLGVGRLGTVRLLRLAFALFLGTTTASAVHAARAAAGLGIDRRQSRRTRGSARHPHGHTSIDIADLVKGDHHRRQELLRPRLRTHLGRHRRRPAASGPQRGNAASRATLLQTAAPDHRVDQRHPQRTTRPRTPRWPHHRRSRHPRRRTHPRAHRRRLAQRPPRPHHPPLADPLRPLTPGITHLGVQTSGDVVDFSGREALQRFRVTAGIRHARQSQGRLPLRKDCTVNAPKPDTFAPNIRPDCTDELTAALGQRIMVIDGAMGTAIQRDRPDEAGYRGDRFTEWPTALQGNNDLLNLTQPQIIAGIHREYLEAGADILETNTFNANAISLSDYDMADLSYELNYAGAALARKAADEFSTPDKPRYVAGVMGPTTRTASISPDVNDPGARNVSYDQLVAAYLEAANGLVDGGADLIIVETIFDSLNAKAAVFAVETLFEERGRRWPVIISGTITDASGRTLSGQVTEAFWNAIRHAKPIAVGLNCALGAPEMRPYIAEMARIADTYVSCYPNAGLPNAFGEYDESPERQAGYIAEFAEAGLVNLVGGCCGTTPAHIAEIAKVVEGKPQRELPTIPVATRLAGLEPLNITDDSLFVNIGERTNITGSARFRNLIKAEDYDTALSVALQQVEVGAQVIDINMDEGMIDGVAAMDRFTKLIAAEPDISRVPVMIDSSKWEVIEAGLKNVQGKPIVNSISMKEGEEKFIREARLCRKYGAAVVVMAFDEKGQADNLERRKEICGRAYRILTEEVGFPPEDIIFDPNCFALATGIEEHATYGIDFIEACAWIKENLPGVHISGGISNVSFSFRGNNPVREAIHSVFLFHAIKAGLDMGIVNAGALVPYDSIDPELRDRIEDVVLNRREDAAERLLEIAEKFNSSEKTED